MEILLTVISDVFEVPAFYLKSCALLMLFHFCTDSENKMGNKISPPPKKISPPSYPPHPKKPKTTKLCNSMYLNKRSYFVLILGNHTYFHVYNNIHICIYVHCVFLIVNQIGWF